MAQWVKGKGMCMPEHGEKVFYLVMTDALDDRPTELINPIDPAREK